MKPQKFKKKPVIRVSKKLRKKWESISTDRNTIILLEQCAREYCEKDLWFAPAGFDRGANDYHRMGPVYPSLITKELLTVLPKEKE